MIITIIILSLVITLLIVWYRLKKYCRTLMDKVIPINSRKYFMNTKISSEDKLIFEAIPYAIYTIGAWIMLTINESHNFYLKEQSDVIFHENEFIMASKFDCWIANNIHKKWLKKLLETRYGQKIYKYLTDLKTSYNPHYSS